MRKFILSVLTLIIASTACVFAGCGKDDESKEPKPTEYLVTFNFNFEGASAPTMIKTDAEGKLTLIGNPEREGYNFSGWYLDAECKNAYSGEIITSDMTLYAKWTKQAEKYNVVFMVGETENDKQTVEENTIIKLPNYNTEENIRFNGWLDEDNKLYLPESEYTVMSNITFHAEFTDLYKVEYDLNGGQGDAPSYAYYARGEKFTLPTGEGLSKNGSTFKGWSTGKVGELYEGGTEFTLPTSDAIVFKAQWDGEYSLSFDGNGSTTVLPEAQNYADGTKITLPSAPEFENHVFKGWTDGEKLYPSGSEFVMPMGDVVLTAEWNEIITINYYYNYYGNNELFLSKKMESGKRISRPQDPDRKEHRFINWYTEPECINIVSYTQKIKEDINLYAGWEHDYLDFTPTADRNAFNVSAAENMTFEDVVGNELIIPETYDGKPVIGVQSNTSMSGLWPLFATINKTPFTSVRIPSHWTEIGDCAFATCKNLKQVNLAEGCQITKIGKHAFTGSSALITYPFQPCLTDIGEEAFLYCREFKSADLSQTKVTEIKKQAFARCFKMEEFKFPANVTKIENFAFENCVSLKRIVIPDTVTYIGAWTFSNQDGINDAYDDSLNGKGIVYDDLSMYYERYSTGGKDYITEYHSVLEYVYIPASVTKIGRGAFAFAENLKTVEFAPDFSMDAFEDYLFYGTAVNNFTIPSTVKSLGKAVFMRCSNLGDFSVPVTLEHLGRRTFAETNITSIHFDPNTKLNFDPICLFYGSNLPSINIPASVTKIGAASFHICNELKTVTFASKRGLEEIEANAFFRSGLESIELPETLRKIGDQAFADCKLKSIFIPSSVSNGLPDEEPDQNKVGTWLGKYVFANISTLEKVELAKDCKLQYFGFYMFRECNKLTTVILSDNMITLNNEAVEDLYGMQVATWYTNHVFNKCTALATITIPETNKYIFAEGNAVYTKEYGKYAKYENLQWYSLADPQKEVRVKDGVKNVEDWVFYEHNNINKIVIPSSVEIIGNAVMEQSKNLNEIVFEKGSQLKTIGNFCFGNMSTYPSTVNENGLILYDYSKPPVSAPFQSITFESALPPSVGTNIFVHSTERAGFAIYVPAESVSAYKVAKGWDIYAEFIKAKA